MTQREAEVIMLKAIIRNRDLRPSLIEILSKGKISDELQPLFIAVFMCLENKDELTPEDLAASLTEEAVESLFENPPTEEEIQRSIMIFNEQNAAAKQAIQKIALWKKVIDNLTRRLDKGEITPETWIERTLNVLPSSRNEKAKILREDLEKKEKDLKEAMAEISALKGRIIDAEASVKKAAAAEERTRGLESELRIKDTAISSQNEIIENLKKDLRNEREKLEKLEKAEKEQEATKKDAGEEEAEKNRIAEEERAKISELEGIIKDKDGEIAAVKAEITEKDGLIDQLKIAVRSLGPGSRPESDPGKEKEIERLKAENDGIRAENEALRKEIDGLDSASREKEEKLNSLRTKAKALLQKTKDRESVYEASKAEIEELRKKLKDAENRSRDDREALENGERRIRDLENENEALKNAADSGSSAKITPSEKELIAKNALIKSRDDQIARMKAEIESLKKKKSEDRNEHRLTLKPAHQEAAANEGHPETDAKDGEASERAKEAVSLDAWDSVLENITDNAPSVFPPLRTGFEPINQNLGGLSGLTVIQSDPKRGKTSMALQIAFDTLVRNRDAFCVYYTTDHLPEALYCRLISQISGIPVREIENGNTDFKERHDREMLKQSCELIDDCRNRMAIVGMEHLPDSMEDLKLHMGAIMEKNVCDRGVLIIDALPAFLSHIAHKSGHTSDEILGDLRAFMNIYALTIVGTGQGRESSDSEIMKSIMYASDHQLEIQSDKSEKTDTSCIDLIISVTSRNSEPFLMNVTYNPPVCRFTGRNKRFKARKIAPQPPGTQMPKQQPQRYQKQKPALS